MKQCYKIYIALVLLIVASIFAFVSSSQNRVGFQTYNTVRWSKDLLTRFKNFQDMMNIQYNMDEIQKQVSPEEAEEFLKNGSWDWPEELQNVYMEKISTSPIVKIDPHFALKNAMQIYNKNAATELLAWNSKEGEFLLNGGVSKDKKIVKCSNNIDSMVKMMGQQIEIKIKPQDIPKEMPGFSFVSGECNPCNIFSYNSESKQCPFRLNVNGDDSISYPWKKMWDL